MRLFHLVILVLALLLMMSKLYELSEISKKISETIHTRMIFDLDLARDQYLRDIRYYFGQGCYAGTLYSDEEKDNWMNFCIKAKNKSYDQFMYSLNSFAKRQEVGRNCQ